MSSNWETLPLGEIAKLEIETIAVEPGSKFDYAGVYNEGRGVFNRGVLKDTETSYPKLHVLRPNRIVMRKLTAWEGPIAVVPEEFDGFVVSPEFPTFLLDSTRITPEFASLICQRSSFWGKMAERATGSVQRRKRVSPSQLLAIEVSIPSIAEQWRIVDLISSADSMVSACERALRAAVVTSGRVRENEISSLPKTPLRSLIERIEAGKSFQAERRPPSADERGVLKVSAIQQAGFVAEESKAVTSGIFLDPRWEVQEGDVLMTRANSPERVGMVCRVHKVRPGLFLCDKTLRLVSDPEVVDPDFLAYAMQTDEVRSRLTAAATGTSASMVNVSQQKIMSLEVAFPELPQQQRIADLLRAQGETVSALERKLGSAKDLRNALLEDLLSGRHLIPDSYDHLLN